MKWCCCLGDQPEGSKSANQDTWKSGDKHTREGSTGPKSGDKHTREGSTDPKSGDKHTREGLTDPKSGDKHTREGSTNSKSGDNDTSERSTDQYTRERLKRIYNHHFRSAGLYRTVRILVVGRSGSGKTTLIRLIVGKEGPGNLGNQAVAGEQDISKEWRCLQDEGLPELVIHDSNGMDVQGEKNLEVVKQFIEERQKGNEEESERINLIWYVFNASDNRFADDCNLMQIVADSAIPVLLIMTYNDVPQLVKQHVTVDNVNRLLKDIRDERKKDKIKAHMVRIGNRVELDPITKEITGDLDKKGLKEISKKSMKLLDDKLKYTWIAAQVVDLESKMDASITLILESAKSALHIPNLLEDGQELEPILYTIHTNVCSIWRVPEYLSSCLLYELLLVESSHGIKVTQTKNTSFLIHMLGILITAGVNHKLTKWLSPEVDKKAHKASKVVITYELRLLLAILYIKSRQTRENRSLHSWDTSATWGHYRNLCAEFMDLSEDHVPESGLNVINVLRKWTTSPETIADLISDFAVENYGLYLMDRPSSLKSLFRMSDKTSREPHEEVDKEGALHTKGRNVLIGQDIESKTKIPFDHMLNNKWILPNQTMDDHGLRDLKISSQAIKTYQDITFDYLYHNILNQWKAYSPLLSKSIDYILLP